MVSYVGICYREAAGDRRILSVHGAPCLADGAGSPVALPAALLITWDVGSGVLPWMAGWCRQLLLSTVCAYSGRDARAALLAALFWLVLSGTWVVGRGAR